MKDMLRKVIFRPYRKGMGPSFTLTMWDTGKRTHDHRDVIGYKLTSSVKSEGTIFHAEDFHPAPHIAVDSDHAVESLMSFLTLRPGDTDEEYFERYTPKQMHFAETHAEALGMEVDNRYNDENGNPKSRRDPGARKKGSTAAGRQLFERSLEHVQSKSIREWANSPRNRGIFMQIASGYEGKGGPWSSPTGFAAYIAAQAIGL